MNAKTRRTIIFLMSAVFFAFGIGRQAHAEWKIASADGKSQIKIGFLAQLQAESIDTTDAKRTSTNIYFRRLRFILGGKANEHLSFFLDTDCPNLGKSDSDGKKNDSSIYIQDMFVTYTFRDEFMLDGGLFLVPNSYNTLQSAANPLTLDLASFSYLSSSPTGARVNRDYGFQARGYVMKKHVEYRVGAFQGARGKDSTMPLRWAGRVAIWPLEAQTGIYYFGTGFGQKKIVSIGAGVDHQQDYQSVDMDFFTDLPIFGHDAITFQTDWIRYDGGHTFTQLPRQDAWLVEAGYYFSKIKITPYVQYNGLEFKQPGQHDENRYQGGISYWPNGHNMNIKFAVTSLRKQGSPNRIQVQLQVQVFQF